MLHFVERKGRKGEATGEDEKLNGTLMKMRVLFVVAGFMSKKCAIV